MSEQNKGLEVMKFDAINIPTPFETQEKSNDKYIWYGTDNLYPNYLLKLYNESPIHASILNAKANYIIGDGIKAKNGAVIHAKVNVEDTIEDFLSKVVKDYLLYNYFCIEVIYNTLNQPIEYHFIPANKIRANKDKTKFWYSEDWSLGKKPIQFEAWKPYSKDATSKIYFFDGYNPSLSNVYPTPDYHGTLKSIQTDIEIRNFNLNNILNEFSVSTIITFFMGELTDEKKAEVLKRIKNNYTGSQGRKLMLDFQNPLTGKPAEVKNIMPSDWDKAYELVARKVSDDIMIGHQVTSPMLFGVKTEGQLGGATELETSYEIFKNTYIRNKRNELEGALNYLFLDSALIQDKIEFADRPLFTTQIKPETLEKVMTVNEIRKERGLPALPNGDRLITEAVATPVQPIQQSKFNGEYFHLSEEDFEKIQHLGITSEEFEFIQEGEEITSKEDFSRIELKFETSQEIADYLINNQVQGKTVAEIKSDLRKDLGINISQKDLQSTLKTLNDAGVININIEENKVSVKPVAEDAPKRSIQVMYSYDVRPGLGEPIIDTTRAFCKKLVTNNRLYTREEIQTMASIFGYDIYKFGGGYYRNPDTGEVTTHCRHQFVSKTVSRRVR